MPVLLDEIRKGPSSLSISLESVRNPSKVLAARIATSGKVAFIGSGSSYNAALPAAWLLNRCGFPAWVVQASDVKDFGYGFPTGTVPVLISVSGNGEDIIGAARRVLSGDPACGLGRSLGQEKPEELIQQRAQRPNGELHEAVRQPIQRPAAVCNTPGAPLLKFVEEEILLGVDPQRSEAATHTFIASMGALLWLAFDILEIPGSQSALSGCQVAGLKSALTGLPEIMDLVLQRSLSMMPSIILDCSRGDDVRHCSFLGQNMALVGLGPSYASALDGALKIQEVAQVFAQAHPGENVLHGPAYPIAYHKTPLVVLGSLERDEVCTRLVSIFTSLGCPVLYLTPVVRSEVAGPGVQGGLLRVLPFSGETDGGPGILGAAQKGDFPQYGAGIFERTYCGPFQEVFLPFLHIIALQVMAYYLGERKGLNVDVPPTKAKQLEVLESLGKGRRFTDRELE